MPDKFRKTQPLKITFSEGEQPTAQKLTAVAQQSRNGSDLMEHAIGDLWNSSGDVFLGSNPLQIPNLARLLGGNEYLNPALFPAIETFQYTDHLGLKFENLNVGHLNFAPTEGTVTSSPIPTSYVIDTDTNGNFVTPVSNEYEVDAAGKFWIDAATGRFRVYGVLAAADKISYEVNPEASDGWVIGDETLPGVIPDPGQSDFTSCRVSESGGTFYLHLPPRMPLTLSDRERPSRYPPSAAYSDNQTGVVGAPYKLWQTDATALTGAGSEHYRYQLPKEIVDILDAQPNGTELPAGFMFIYDETTGTVIDDVVFRKPSAGGFLKYVIEIESVQYDFTPHVTASEAEANYSSSGLILITCGSPLARQVWTLAAAHYRHGHRNDGTLEDTISHNDLEDTDPPYFAHADHVGRYPGDVLSWGPSRWANDSHVSLLSRVGSREGGSTRRDENDNAMLGDFVLASTAISGGNFLNFTAESNKILFGDSDSTTAPYLMGRNSGTEILAANSSLHVGDVADIGLTLSNTQFDHGFGLGSVEDPIYLLLTVIDTEGNEVRVDTHNDSLTGGDTGYSINVNGTIPPWVVSYRVYKSATNDFSVARDYWEDTSSISWGDYPGQTAVDGTAIPGDDTSALVVLEESGPSVFRQSLNAINKITVFGQEFGGTGNTNAAKLEMFQLDDTNNPKFQLQAYADDDISLAFDAYWDGSNWVSSDQGSNFRIRKFNDRLRFEYGDNEVIGTSVAWSESFAIDDGGILYVTSQINALADVNVDVGDLYVSPGNFGVGTSSPQYPIHIETSAISGHSALADADNLVIEENGNAGLTIASSTSGQGSIYFDDSVEGRGRIVYDHSTDDMWFYTNGALQMELTSAGLTLEGTLVVEGEQVSLGSSNVMWFEKDGTNNVLAFHNVSIARDEKSSLLVDTFYNISIWGQAQATANNPAFRVIPRCNTSSYTTALGSPMFWMQSLETSGGDNAPFMIARNAHRDQDSASANDLADDSTSPHSSILFDSSGGISLRYAAATAGNISWTTHMQMTDDGVGFGGDVVGSGVNTSDETVFIVGNGSGDFPLLVENRANVSSGHGIRLTAGRDVGDNGTIWFLANAYNTGNFQGSLTTSGGVFVVSSASDARLKKNFRDPDFDCLDMINSLPVKAFEWITSNETTRAGFVAQDVEPLMPELVCEPDPESDTKAVSAELLIPVLVKAMQQQQAVINDLTTRLEALEA